MLVKRLRAWRDGVIPREAGMPPKACSGRWSRWPPCRLARSGSLLELPDELAELSEADERKADSVA